MRARDVRHLYDSPRETWYETCSESTVKDFLRGNLKGKFSLKCHLKFHLKFHLEFRLTVHFKFFPKGLNGKQPFCCDGRGHVSRPRPAEVALLGWVTECRAAFFRALFRAAGAACRFLQCPSAAARSQRAPTWEWARTRS